MTSQDIAVPSAALPIGRLRSTATYAKSILVDLAHRALLRRRRHRNQVAADYEAGEWAQQKAARSWEATATLEAYSEKNWADRELIAEMDGRLWRVPSAAYYRFRRRKLIAILEEFDGGAATLVELGSGTGSNLFALATSPRWSKLVGLELSRTGREVANKVAEHFGVTDRLEIGPIDLLDPASEGFSRLKGAVCFTHYCLEQLPDHTEMVFRNLISAGVKRAILIEPSFELLGRSTLRDWASRTYVLRQDYQRSILRVARKLEAERLLETVAVRRLDFVSSHRNAPTLLVWDAA